MELRSARFGEGGHSKDLNNTSHASWERACLKVESFMLCYPDTGQ